MSCTKNLRGKSCCLTFPSYAKCGTSCYIILSIYFLLYKRTTHFHLQPLPTLGIGSVRGWCSLFPVIFLSICYIVSVCRALERHTLWQVLVCVSAFCATCQCVWLQVASPSITLYSISIISAYLFLTVS